MMRNIARWRIALVGPGLAMMALSAASAVVQDNPYRVAAEAWGELPNGRVWGSTSAVHPGPHGTLWVAERCGQNSCLAREDIDPILQFDASGRFVTSFGAGLFVWPHGIDVDSAGNVWVTDGRARDGKGFQVFKFSSDGEVLMTLGRKGFVDGDFPDTFSGPTDVQIAPNGNIFVADGHGPLGNNRIVKFSSDGELIKAWGRTGSGIGEFDDPHALAMDSQGRLFVGDRGNNRIQIFDQEGNCLASWTQFGRPSGLFIDQNDILYVADSESRSTNNRGFKRGIRIGSAKDGWVTAFIPDREPEPDNSVNSGAEGVAADAMGNVYGAEVSPRTLKKYVKR